MKNYPCIVYIGMLIGGKRIHEYRSVISKRIKVLAVTVYVAYPCHLISCFHSSKWGSPVWTMSFISRPPHFAFFSNIMFLPRSTVVFFHTFQEHTLQSLFGDALFSSSILYWPPSGNHLNPSNYPFSVTWNIHHELSARGYHRSTCVFDDFW